MSVATVVPVTADSVHYLQFFEGARKRKFYQVLTFGPRADLGWADYVVVTNHGAGEPPTGNPRVAFTGRLIVQSRHEGSEGAARAAQRIVGAKERGGYVLQMAWTSVGMEEGQLAPLIWNDTKAPTAPAPSTPAAATPKVEAARLSKADKLTALALRKIEAGDIPGALSFRVQLVAEIGKRREAMQMAEAGLEALNLRLAHALSL